MKNFFSFLLILLQFVLSAEEPTFDFQTSIDLMNGKWMESSIDIVTLGRHPVELKRIFQPAKREEIFTSNWGFSLPDFGKKELPRRKWAPPKGSCSDLNYDSEGRISSLNVTNEKNGTDEGWLQFEYTASQCKVVSNSGDFVVYGITENNCLSYVETSQNERYDYVYVPHPFERSFLLAEKRVSNGQWIKLTYYTSSDPRDFKNGKIKEIFYSEDSGATFIRTALLDYEPGVTTVLDARHVLTRYRYRDLKIIGIETVLQNGSIYKSTELEWDENHLVKKIEKDASNNPVRIQKWIYNQGNIVEETLEGNLTALGTSGESFKKFYRYDKENRLIEEREEGGLCIAYTYLGTHKRPSEKHVLDQAEIVERTCFVYDSENRLIQTWVEDAGKIKTFEKVNGFNFLDAPLEISKGIVNLSTHEELLLERTVYEYDQRGQVTRVSKYDKFGSETSWCTTTYDGKNIKEINSSDGSSVLFFPNEKHIYQENEEKIIYYSNLGQILKEEHYSHGQKIGYFNYIYDATGGLISKIENGTSTTSYTYDSLGRKIKEETPEILSQEDIPEKGITHFHYDSLDRATCTTYPDGSVKQMIYNVRGQPLAEYLSCGTCFEKSYYLNGQLEKEVYPDKTFHLYSYDTLGRLLRKTQHCSSGSLIDSKEYVYSGSQLVQEIFASGLSLHYFYDFCGNLTESFCPETGRKISYHYDKSGTLTHQKEYFDIDSCIVKEVQKPDEPKPATVPSISWIQNNRGQLVAEKTVQHGNGTYSKLLYDALNHLEKITTYSPCGTIQAQRDLRHDFNGRKTKEVIILSNSESITNIWNYDSKGNLETFIEGKGSPVERKTLYRYTGCGKLESQTNGDGITVFYTYEDSGKISSIYSDDNTVHYTLQYDANGRINRILDRVHNLESTRTYTLDGQVLTEQLSNGLSFENTYDLLGRRTALILPDLSSIHYQFEGENLKEIIRKNAAGKTQYSQNQTSNKLEMVKGLGEITYTRNERGQLTAIQSPYFKQTASYDEKNKLISLTTQDSEGNYFNSYQYSPDSLEEKGFSPATYNFDDLENLSQKDNQLFTSNALNQLFSSELVLEYDLNGNLIKKIANGDTFLFTYDAFGRMLQVKKNDELIHDYIYDLYHRRLSDKESVFFLYDGNWEIGSTDSEKNIQELRIFDESKTNCIAFEIKNAIYAPICNINGSIACIINTETKEAASFRYTAFGEVMGEASLPWLFANKRYDPLTGLVHFGRRDYNPATGRFITPDPLGFTDGSNRYAYCHNDPLNRLDVFGLQSELSNEAQTESPGFFEVLKEKFLAIFESIKNAFCLRPKQVFEHMTGNGFLLLSGYNSTEKQVGYYGKGELNNKVRVSYINGILTEEHGLMDSVKALSECHGNVNIHYVYRPTKGWVRDILTSLAVTLGFVSEQAEMLADLWKEMIEDMGGLDGGGKIIHYAHSIGAKETMRALSLLTKEQQQLVHVYAFGSPSVAVENPNYQIRHFISIRDGVCLLDLASFIRACKGEISNVVFTGTALGIPLVDHLFRDQTYQDIWKSMGRTFTEWYGYL